MSLSPSAKRTGAGTILVILIGICIYAWSPKPAKVEVDQTIAQSRQSYTCPHCGHLFDLTIKQVTNMRRTRGDIVCLACGESGARRSDALAGQSPTATTPSGDDPADQEVIAEEDLTRPPRAMGGMRKKPDSADRP